MVVRCVFVAMFGLFTIWCSRWQFESVDFSLAFAWKIWYCSDLRDFIHFKMHTGKYIHQSPACRSSLQTLSIHFVALIDGQWGYICTLPGSLWYRQMLSLESTRLPGLDTISSSFIGSFANVTSVHITDSIPPINFFFRSFSALFGSVIWFLGCVVGHIMGRFGIQSLEMLICGIADLAWHFWICWSEGWCGFGLKRCD